MLRSMPIRALIAFCLTGLPALVPRAAWGHGPDIENRIGVRSEAVIRNELRQGGITVRSVELERTTARVAVRMNGRDAVLEIDRLGGGARVVSGDAAARAALWPKLKPPAVLTPAPPARRLKPGKPVRPVKPTERVTPIRPRRPVKPTRPLTP